VAETIHEFMWHDVILAKLGIPPDMEKATHDRYMALGAWLDDHGHHTGGWSVTLDELRTIGATPDTQGSQWDAVMQAIGAASVCWENPAGGGVFDSERAAAIGDELLALWVELPPAVHADITDHIYLLNAQLDAARADADRLAEALRYFANIGYADRGHRVALARHDAEVPED